MIPDKIGDFATVSLFGGERWFDISSAAGARDPAGANARMDALLAAAGAHVANEIDGRISDALRNTLFGAFGEDLAARNIFRGRDVGVPWYKDIARCHGVEPDAEARCSCFAVVVSLRQIFGGCDCALL